MAQSATGVLWPSLTQQNGTWIRKWLYGSVFIRNWDPLGSTSLAGFTPFAADGNLDPKLTVPIAQGGYGFYDVGALTETGVEFTPKFSVDETKIWQSRRSQRTDITQDDEEIMFSCTEGIPLIDYLFYNLPLVNIPSVGANNYNLQQPNYSDVTYYQLVIVGVDGSVNPGGVAQYDVELRPRVSLCKKGKKQWAAKQIDITELTYCVHPDPASGFSAAKLRGGIVWTDEGGAPTFAVPNAWLGSPPAANTAAVLAPSGLGGAPSTTGGTFAAGTYYWTVTATTANGETVASNEITATLTGSTSSNVLTWTQVTGATGYKVYRGTVSGQENKLITTIGSGSTVTYTDTGTAGATGFPPTTNTATIPAPTTLAGTPSTAGGTLAANTYWWVVTATTAAGETVASNEITATLTGATSSNALTWAADTGATGYNIYRGTAAGGENALAGTSTTNAFTDTGASVFANAIGSGKATLKFQQPTTPQQSFTYTVTQTTGGSTTPASVLSTTVAANGDVTITVQSLTATNVYTFTVKVTAGDTLSATYPVSNSITAS